METKRSVVIELTVNNHPGVMAQITGLFSRRAFNLEGIFCMPLEHDRTRSGMLLLVDADERLDQTVKQLRKLYDVLAITVREGCGRAVFDRLRVQW